MTITEFLLARITEDEEGPFLNAWHVGRVRAECEAKRRIVEAWRFDLDEGVEDPHQLFAVKCLASVYADHPDYRDEWRP